MSKETNRVMGHADEADGIEEYDNPLPDWWLGLLWLTVIWGIGYAIHYHFIGNRSQERHLAAEVAEAAVRWPAQTIDASQFVMSDEAIAAGKQVYEVNCVVCHGADLEGGIGPTLTDDEWIHGSEPIDVITTITEGVPLKGMIPWGPILTPEQINQVAAYVLSENAAATGQSPPEE